MDVLSSLISNGYVNLLDTTIQAYGPPSPEARQLIKEKVYESGWQVACRMEIGWEYLEHSIMTADLIFIATRTVMITKRGATSYLDGKRVRSPPTQTPTESIVALATSKIIGSSAYLSLVCASSRHDFQGVQMGLFLMCCLQTYLRNEGVQNMHLHTHTGLIGYYQDLGWTVGKSCGQLAESDIDAYVETFPRENKNDNVSMVLCSFNPIAVCNRSLLQLQQLQQQF